MRTFVREVKNMTFSMILSTLFEILLFATAVWCFFHEDRLVAFERRIIAHFKRKKFKVLKSSYNSADYSI
jgi:hypothetical protein